jgi:hypothetical protein
VGVRVALIGAVAEVFAVNVSAGVAGFNVFVGAVVLVAWTTALVLEGGTVRVLVGGMAWVLVGADVTLGGGAELGVTRAGVNKLQARIEPSITDRVIKKACLRIVNSPMNVSIHRAR